ncbi:hypothetical protein N6W67_05220 [Proteus mirabilis]|nr:hypothetical protein [Proteus mirabilis]UXJ01546.1 hypothetical protein N6W67_05220 [Proteus mirabilis]
MSEHSSAAPHTTVTQSTYRAQCQLWSNGRGFYRRTLVLPQLSVRPAGTIDGAFRVGANRTLSV